MKLHNGYIRLQKYEFNPTDILGKGSTGNVYRGYRLKDGGRVAIKAIDMKQVSNEVTKYLLGGEKTAMSTVKSPFVAFAEDIIQEKDFCYIVMELCSGGTLKDYIQKRGKLEEIEAIDIFRKLIAGYVSITQAKIIHRDLKTANIMMRFSNDPAIIDFGYCEMIMGKRPQMQYNVGSPSYMSPEAHFKSMYSEKSDIWALGIILYEMLTGMPLDVGKQSHDYFNQLRKSKIARYSKEKFSELVRNIFDKAFLTNPEERGTTLKIKYIIDKAMIGRLPPLNANGKPMIFPSNNLRKMKSMNFQINHSGNPEITLRKQPSDVLKPRISFNSPQPNENSVYSSFCSPERKDKLSSIQPQLLRLGDKMRTSTFNPISRQQPQVMSKSASENTLVISQRLITQYQNNKISLRSFSPGKLPFSPQKGSMDIQSPTRMPRSSQQIRFMIGSTQRKLSENIANQESPRMVHKPISFPSQVPQQLQRVKSEGLIRIQRAF